MIDSVDLVFVSAINSGHDCIHVYDSLTGSLLHSYKGIQAAPSSLSITGPNKLVLCGCKDRALLQAWQIHKREAVSATLSIPGRVHAMAVSPVHPSILVAGIKETLHIYSLESGCRLAVISRHFQTVTSIVFTTCGNFFFSAGEDGLVYMWRVHSIIEASNEGTNEVRPFKQLLQHSDKVTQMCVSSNRIVTVSSDHSARIYCLQSLVILHTIVFNNEQTSVAITEEGTRLAVGSVSGHVTVLDLFPATMAQTIRIQDTESIVCHEGGVVSLQILPTGCTVVSAGQQDGEVKVWQVKDNTSNAFTSLSSNEGENKQVNSSVKSLSWKRTFHKGKGAVTNMVSACIDRQILTKGWSIEQEVTDLHTKPINETSVPLTSDQCVADAFLNTYSPDIKKFAANYGEDLVANILMKNLQ